MRNVLYILLWALLLTLLFFIFHPENSFLSAIESGMRERNINESLAEYYHSEANLDEVTGVAKRNLNFYGTGQTFIHYCLAAPYLEEMQWRGVVLLFCLLLGTNKNWKCVLAWAPSIIVAYFWAMTHKYPPLYQAAIFYGGLINAACIIHLPDTKAYKALGMLMAIGLHSLVNAVYVTAVILFA